MKKDFNESAFALSIIASCFPFVTLLLFLLDPNEPHDFTGYRILFSILLPLVEGSIIGSVFGVIAIIVNRRRKYKKVYILSLVPVFILILSVLIDSIYLYRMP